MQVQGMESSQLVKNTAIDKSSKKWEVAKQFESMFVNEMFKAMRKTVSGEGLTEASPGRKIFTSMLDQEYADSAGETNSLGLADIIYRQMDGDDTAAASSISTAVAGRVTFT